MEKFTFYYEENIGGNKYKETIEADNFRIARDMFFESHKNIPHRIDAIWNETICKRLA